MSNFAGQLLIAVPELADLNFFRSVVLLFQHNEEGAAGLILNRPSNLTVGEVARELMDEPLKNDQPLSLGGPVDGPLMALHTSLTLAEMQVVPGVFFSMQRENLRNLLRQSQHEYRLFSGYSGWDSSQLESELQAGGWLSIPADRDHVFAEPEQLWRQVCEDVGTDIIFAARKPRQRPPSPGWN